MPTRRILQELREVVKPEKTPLRVYAWDLAHRLASGRGPAPLLVCADRDQEKCKAMKIGPTVSFQEFTSRLESLPKDTEIVFYCESAQDPAAVERAAEYLERGYSRAGSLSGGLEAWNTIANFLPGRR